MIKQIIKTHLKNIYLLIALAIFGVILRLNRLYLWINFIGRVEIEHFVAFLFFPIFFITLLFPIAEGLIKGRRVLLGTKFWIIVVTLCANVSLIFFWEIYIQNLQTGYQMITDFIATIVSFGYLYWYYNH